MHLTHCRESLILSLLLSVGPLCALEIPSAEFDDLKIQATSSDDEVRHKAQTKLYGIKDKRVVPAIVASLYVEGEKTEVRIRDAQLAGRKIRNPQLPTMHAIGQLIKLSGREILPELRSYKAKYPRYGGMIDREIFALEHDISKPINVEFLEVRIRLERASEPIDWFKLRPNDPPPVSVNTFPIGEDMALDCEVFSRNMLAPDFCAYTSEVLIDNRPVAGGVPMVAGVVKVTGREPTAYPTNGGARFSRISLKDLSPGEHTVTFRLKDTDKMASQKFQIVPKK